MVDEDVRITAPRNILLATLCDGMEADSGYWSQV